MYIKGMAEIAPITIKYVCYNNERINELTNKSKEEIDKYFKENTKYKIGTKKKIAIIDVTHRPSDKRYVLLFVCKTYSINENRDLYTSNTDYYYSTQYKKEEAKEFNFNNFQHILNTLKDSEQINDVSTINKLYVYYKGKQMPDIEGNTNEEIQTEIKKRMKPPKQDKEIRLVSVNFGATMPSYLSVIFATYTIQPTLNMTRTALSRTHSITYSYEEYKHYGFKKWHIERYCEMLDDKQMEVRMKHARDALDPVMVYAF